MLKTNTKTFGITSTNNAFLINTITKNTSQHKKAKRKFEIAQQVISKPTKTQGTQPYEQGRFGSNPNKKPHTFLKTSKVIRQGKCKNYWILKKAQ